MEVHESPSALLVIEAVRATQLVLQAIRAGSKQVWRTLAWTRPAGHSRTRHGGACCLLTRRCRPLQRPGRRNGALAL
eukprot:365408-Chlamydomonas_euryale.AAC.14